MRSGSDSLYQHSLVTDKTRPLQEQYDALLVSRNRVERRLKSLKEYVFRTPEIQAKISKLEGHWIAKTQKMANIHDQIRSGGSFNRQEGKREKRYTPDRGRVFSGKRIQTCKFETVTIGVKKGPILPVIAATSLGTAPFAQQMLGL